jgi:uncharacterized protein
MRSLPAITGFVIVAAITAGAAAAEEPAWTVTVVGEGTASAAPDTATIETGVATQAENAKGALARNNEAMTKILQAVKQHNVASKDVQTANFSLFPVYKGQNTPSQEEIVGYRVVNEVRIRVRKLAELGGLLDALVQAGSNQVSGIHFSTDDPAAILAQARTRAFQDARARATTYAQAAGLRIGRVRSISEEVARGPRPVGGMMRAAPMNVPIATGEQQFHATVTVAFELLAGGAKPAGH